MTLTVPDQHGGAVLYRSGRGRHEHGRSGSTGGPGGQLEQAGHHSGRDRRRGEGRQGGTGPGQGQEPAR